MLSVGLDEHDIKKLAEIAHEQDFFKDAVIFNEDDIQDGLYVLFEGKISIERHLLSGRNIGRRLIQNVRHGQIIGEMGFVERRTRSATATAHSRVRLALIKFVDIDILIEQNPKLGIKLLRNIAEVLSSRLRRMNEQWLRASMDNDKRFEFEYY